MHTRREWLFAIPFTLGVIGGCTNPQNTEQHALGVHNVGSTSRRVHVLLTGSDEDQIFEDELLLEANTAVEDRVIRGSPARVAVSVDEGESIVFDWAPEQTTFVEEYPNGCRGQNTISLRIEVSDDGFDGQEADVAQTNRSVRLVYGCAYPGSEG